LHGAHRMLRVRMECLVEVGERPSVDVPTALPAQQQMQLQGGAQMQSQTQAIAPPPPLAWEAVREAIRREPQLDDLIPASMSEPTPLVPLSEGARQYASTSFDRGRPWLAAVTELMRRIHDDFEFEPGATTVSTSVDEVLYQKRGVCQDFAHLMLACLRGHGLPARYVSGYLLTDPPPGMPRLMGADASHAWVAAWSPQHGWVEFDPTNNQLADQRYITLTWGADFADVVPLRGVIFGGGDQRMDVEVSVIPA
ncbi:MAG: transglutaminase family protein, partial [Pseudomonadota bacterium]